MDPYKARQNAIKKMLFDELEAQLHNTDICDRETDRFDMIRFIIFPRNPYRGEIQWI